jgi:large subunit ribosomal protein L22
MSLDKARQFLFNVVTKKNSVPYRRYKKKVPHKTGIVGWYAGRYPVKAATEVLKIIDNLEANADDKGLNFEKLKIIHAATHKARKIKGYIPRAFGRSSPRHNQLTHIELVIKEME